MRTIPQLLLAAAVCISTFGQAVSTGQFMYIGTLNKKLLVIDENKEEVVAEIPLTDWHRPIPGSLPTDGLGHSTKKLPAWYRDPSTGRYRSLTTSLRDRLLAS